MVTGDGYMAWCWSTKEKIVRVKSWGNGGEIVEWVRPDEAYVLVK